MGPKEFRQNGLAVFIFWTRSCIKGMTVIAADLGSPTRQRESAAPKHNQYFGW